MSIPKGRPGRGSAERLRTASSPSPCSPPWPTTYCRRIEGAAHGINYGFDRVRFVHPVRSGSRVRGHFTLVSAAQRSKREWQLTYDVSVEIEGAQKPALAATWLTMQVMGAT